MQCLASSWRKPQTYLPPERRKSREIAQLAPEAKILVIATTLAAWKKEEERQEGETKTERKADSDSEYLEQHCDSSEEN